MFSPFEQARQSFDSAVSSSPSFTFDCTQSMMIQSTKTHTHTSFNYLIHTHNNSNYTHTNTGGLGFPIQIFSGGHIDVCVCLVYLLNYFLHWFGKTTFFFTSLEWFCENFNGKLRIRGGFQRDATRTRFAIYQRANTNVFFMGICWCCCRIEVVLDLLAGVLVWRFQNGKGTQLSKMNESVTIYSNYI